MTTQAQSYSFPAIWKRILKVLRGEGLKGLWYRIQDRGKTDFGYLHGYLVACPIEEQAVVPPHPAGMQVAMVKPEDPGILGEIAQIYGGEYTEDMILTRWQQQRLLCFIGRVDGEAVGCVWVNPGGAVVEFNKAIFRLSPSEAYYKDAWVMPKWRGKSIYPVIKSISGQILRDQYGKKTALSFICNFNTASLNASRKLGGRRLGHIIHLKLFRRRFTWLMRTRPQAIRAGH